MSSSHPLDPLRPAEISSCSALIRYKYPKNWIFNTITLLEPPKYSQVLQNLAPIPIPRKAVALVIEKDNGNEIEFIVNLTEEKIESMTPIKDPESHFSLSSEDCINAERIILSDETVQRRCRELGFPNMDLIVADAWATGYVKDRPKLRVAGQRLVRCFMYARLTPDDNPYAHPLDFTCIADVLSEKVVDIEDLPLTSGCASGNERRRNVEVPKTSLNYDPDLLPTNFFRADLKPIQILSPDGPSFTVKGNLVQWQKFSFRVGFNYREGLVLHDVKYEDGLKKRPLFYRMSLAEMTVPYGDPRPPYHVKCALDAGDCGLGNLTDSLALGCDCLGTIHYFDGVLNNHAGEPVVIKNAICLHEEDDGMLFKHTEYRNGKDVTARSRRLVISFICSIVNYDYGFYWSFYQDGSIKFEVKATGILSTSLAIPNESPSPYSTLLSPGVNGQFHQHIFAVRLDPMLDGLKNEVCTVDCVPLGKDPVANPYGIGFTTRETPLLTTHEAATDSSTETSRFWRIYNPGSIHKITSKPVGYKLVSPYAHKLMASADSYVWEKAGFARHSVWVTPYTDDLEERYPDGRFVFNRNENYTGLHKWAERREALADKDVVLWHVFGITHIPRVEDFPIMPVESASFMLKPHNFFNGNPAVDVPSPSQNESRSQLATEHGRN